jgi:hypothetical protein
MKQKKIFILIGLIFIISLSSTVALANFNNNPPNPPIIEGPTAGQIKVTYLYYFTLTDPDPDDLLFNLEVDFGDNILYENCGCGTSWTNGTIVEVPYQWSRSNDYEIRARVQDEWGDWSEWSESHIVSMPRFKSYNNLQQIINRLILTFPFLSDLLN